MESNSIWKKEKILERWTSSSEKETFSLGKRWAETWQRPLTLALDGPLGAGKTRFVAGIVAGLGASEPVSSPSFALVNEYVGGRFPVFHLDFYRLREEAEVWSLGFEDCLACGVVLVEWGSKFPAVFPRDTLQVAFLLSEETAREICIHPLRNQE